MDSRSAQGYLAGMTTAMTPDRPAVRFLDRTTPPHILTLVILSGVSALSMNIFLPSLPAMAEFFGVPYAVMQLSVPLYLLLSGVLQLVLGPLSDRYGRRPVMLVACALFVVATIGTLLATSAAAFLAFRIAQAVIATGFALSRAVVRDMVPDAQAASMIGYVTMGMALVPMIGPMIGGALDEAFGWQASFVFLGLCGIAVGLLVWADLGETATLRQTSLGAQFREYPALFASRRFWGYAICSAASSGAFFSFLGGAPFVGSEIYGLSPATLGIIFGAPAVGYVAGNYLAGRYSVRIGLTRMVLIGSVILCGGLGLLLILTLVGLGGPATFFGLVTLVGLGNGMTLPNATAGMMSVRHDLAGSASGLGGALTIAGGAALAALAGVVLQPGGTEVPLIVVMLASAVVSLVAIRAVIARNRALGIAV
jgi:DHA1 family bicyclomycin/chloramphenicol resistance-like MFS transporter